LSGFMFQMVGPATGKPRPPTVDSFTVMVAPSIMYVDYVSALPHVVHLRVQLVRAKGSEGRENDAVGMYCWSYVPGVIASMRFVLMSSANGERNRNTRFVMRTTTFCVFLSHSALHSTCSTCCGFVVQQAMTLTCDLDLNIIAYQCTK